MTDAPDPNAPAPESPLAEPMPPGPSRGLDGPPTPNMRVLAVCFLVGLVLAVVLANWLAGLKPGNRLVIVNQAATFLDSVTVDPEPAGANWFLRRYGQVQGNDSAWVRLPPGAGDADVKVWREGHVIADHAVFFGGNTIFEVRVEHGRQQGRYRRLGK